ncbi:Calcineurin-like phosphoesterase superfamily domain protein [compost metagenome]
MKLHILSDLHLEHCPADELPVLADALVLAGDICTRSYVHQLIKLTRGYVGAGLPVYYVVGNHEFYQTQMELWLRQLKSYCSEHGVTLLHNRCVVDRGVRIFGSTTWTDYLLDGRSRRSARMRYAEAALNDHRLIVRGAGKKTRWFTAGDALKAHLKALRVLDIAFQEPFAGPSVVITHHAPHPLSVAAQYKGDPLTPAFVSDLRGTIARHRPALWVHGHTHTSFDYQVDGTRIVANPRGYPLQRVAYPGQKIRFENNKFDPDLVIEV